METGARYTRYDTIRYDTTHYIYVRPKADNSQLNLPHGTKQKLECGPMPNVMVALPIIGGALCSTPQSLADAHYLTAVQ